MSAALPASVSAVIAAGAPDAPLDPAAVRRLSERLAACFADSEIIIVAGGMSDARDLALRALVEELPDLTVLFLADAADEAIARLVGMEVAVGDWVLLTQGSAFELALLPDAIAATGRGYDLVSAHVAPPRRDWAERLFARFLRLVHGVPVVVDPPAFRLMSRAASLHIVSGFAGELLLRAEALGAGFPSLLLDRAPQGGALPPAPRTLRRRLSRGLRMMLSGGTAPLRFFGLAGAALAVASLLYSVYIVGIYLLLSDVQRGWTTLSLQLSGFMLTSAIMFMLLAEYVAQIHANASPRRRLAVVRELRSPRSRRAGRLNVVDEAGAFRLGAMHLDLPAAAPAPQDRAAGE